MSNFRAIPQPTGNQTEINRTVKENLERLAGLRGNKIDPLPSTASSADVIAKVNEIIARLSA